MLIREQLHKIIDEIEDEQTLKGFLSLFSSIQEEQQGEHFKSLTKAQKAELLISYEESLDSKNLLSHSEVKKGHSKWL